MPYIITTHQSGLTAEEVAREVAHNPTGHGFRGYSRTAVATLDEALSDVSTIVCNLMAGENFGQYQDQFRAIADSGGSVGPLPDGTTIEVRPVAWRDLIQTMLDAGEDNYPPLIWDTAEDRADILTAFNAQR